MKIRDILKSGIVLSRRNSKFLILFWSTNALLAFIMTIPIYKLLIDSLDNSLLSDQLAVEFNYFWFSQFLSLNHSTIMQLPLAIYAIVGVYIIVQTFYFGGLVSIFNIPKKNLVSDFFYGGVKYWYRFMKVLVISLIFFVLAFKINDWLGVVISSLYGDTEMVITDLILRSLRYLILILLIGIVTVISDYSKVVLAIEEETNILLGIKNAIAFIKNNFRIVFIVFLLIAIIGGVGGIVYNVVESYVPRSPFYFLILSFILQQMLIIFRLFIRMLFCSTEVILYNDLNSEIISVKVQESNVGVN